MKTRLNRAREPRPPAPLSNARAAGQPQVRATTCGTNLWFGGLAIAAQTLAERGQDASLLRVEELDLLRLLRLRVPDADGLAFEREQHVRVGHLSRE